MTDANAKTLFVSPRSCETRRRPLAIDEEQHAKMQLILGTMTRQLPIGSVSNLARPACRTERAAGPEQPADPAMPALLHANAARATMDAPGRAPLLPDASLAVVEQV